MPTTASISARRELILINLYDAGGPVQGIPTIPEIIWEFSLGIIPLI